MFDEGGESRWGASTFYALVINMLGSPQAQAYILPDPMFGTRSLNIPTYRLRVTIGAAPSRPERARVSLLISG